MEPYAAWPRCCVAALWYDWCVPAIARAGTASTICLFSLRGDLGRVDAARPAAASWRFFELRDWVERSEDSEMTIPWAG